MTERPILFSAPMVTALLRKSEPKTQTRRIIDHEQARDCDVWAKAPDGTWDAGVYGDGGNAARMIGGVRCRYGVPGDRLWVRETWGVSCKPHGHSSDAVMLEDARQQKPWAAVVYRATDAFADDVDRWRPSIHLPRWACRTLLDVVDIRVERLQEISEEDAAAEGMIRCENGWQSPGPGGYHVGMFPTAREAFRLTWESINHKRAPWASNPWVWRVAFRRIP